ncbi:DsbC family protein [Marinobacterium sp. BA1]|uniref:DsbC family protein n=1 Tax=Marinobacterium sp. BA1 TaxID=3138931 RepID=UPI0032E68E71
MRIKMLPLAVTTSLLMTMSAYAYSNEELLNSGDWGKPLVAVEGGDHPHVSNASKMFSIPMDAINPLTSPLPGFDILAIRGTTDFALASQDGRFLIIEGQLIDAQTGQSLSQAITDRLDRENWDSRVSLLKTIDAHVIDYPAAGEEKAVVTVFTDTTCPFCTRLHNEMKAINDQGITVRYALFPRGGEQSPEYAALTHVLAESDVAKQKTLLDQGFEAHGLHKDSDYSALNAEGKAALDALLNAGNGAGLTGTPYVVMSNGSQFSGFGGVEQFIDAIQSRLDTQSE